MVIRGDHKHGIQSVTSGEFHMLVLEMIADSSDLASSLPLPLKSEL